MLSLSIMSCNKIQPANMKTLTKISKSFSKLSQNHNLLRNTRNYNHKSLFNKINNHSKIKNLYNYNKIYNQNDLNLIRNKFINKPPKAELYVVPQTHELLQYAH